MYYHFLFFFLPQNSFYILSCFCCFINIFQIKSEFCIFFKFSNVFGFSEIFLLPLKCKHIFFLKNLKTI
ncbi:hypothetical protein HanRHA438_Chr13g0600391 [Helianthus annuus]|nr:hypothetical protein HanRHA438_Chr13g0600391 [Helianthus annuus]